MFCKRQGIECVAEQLLGSQERLFSMTLIVIHCSGFGSYNVEIVQSSYSIISLMKFGTVPFNVMLILQCCTDSLQVLPGSSCETFPSSSDGTYVVGYMKFEEDIDIKEEEKVNVKAENGIGSDEEECIDVKDEEGIQNEEEEEEEEDMDIEEEEDVDIKEGVSC